MATQIKKLTQFSPGAGCGCKISPKDLSEILKGCNSTTHYPNLLVGNSNKDDAAVVDINDGRAVISTTDFFTPIVDDPFDYGRISATNAISDIYAMGGKPIMAIAILSWPLEKLGADIASEVMRGAEEICNSAGIPLAGGHSISGSEPIFGLAVTGVVKVKELKRNESATEGSQLYLTKPLGIGLVTTAEKFEIAKEEDRLEALKLMTTLNSVGATLAKFSSVKAMTDVTGFGLLGHTIEMAEGSGLKCKIEWEKVPKIKGSDYYIAKECIPGGTNRNFASYGSKVSPLAPHQKALLCDPQTSGGLLVAIEPSAEEEVVAAALKEGVVMTKIGHFEKRSGEYLVEVI